MKTKIKQFTLLITTAIFTLSIFLPITASAADLTVSENGSESSSEVEVEQETETQIQQTNTANVVNNIQIEANTGDNTASRNTGDAEIKTGDSNINIKVENKLNSSTVETDNCCQQETNAKIASNGSESQNRIEVNHDSTTNINIENNANVVNTIQGTANTGGNSADRNSGNVEIITGDARVKGSVQNGPVNITNVDASSGTSQNQSYLISGNGDQSVNNISTNLNSKINVQIMSYVDLQNKADLDANTGRNSGDRNNNDVKIITGDAIIDFFIKNAPVNIGGVDIDCCDLFDPGDDKDDDKEKPKDDNGNGKVNGGNGENGGKEDGDGDGGGKLLPEAAEDVGGDGIQIIGLSDTTSPAANSLFFWAGLIMIALGLKLIGEEYLPKSSSNQ